MTLMEIGVITTWIICLTFLTLFTIALIDHLIFGENKKVILGVVFFGVLCYAWYFLIQVGPDFVMIK